MKKVKLRVAVSFLFLMTALSVCGCGAAAETEEVMQTETQEEVSVAKNRLEIYEEMKETLTEELLHEKGMDTSIIDSPRTTKGCSFTLPEDFEESQDVPGMYVNEHYPVDASTVYYIEKDKDLSLQLMTEENFKRNMKEELEKVYDSEVEIRLESFEKIEIDGFPSFRILCHYTAEDVSITQLEYIINADKSYVIAYSQTDEYDRMEEFEESAATISLEF